MDFIFHILGLCPDHHNHFNFILFLSEFMSGNFCWCTIKNYLKTNYENIYTATKHKRIKDN